MGPGGTRAGIAWNSGHGEPLDPSSTRARRPRGPGAHWCRASERAWCARSARRPRGPGVQGRGVAAAVQNLLDNTGLD
ncbi:hypothetical protein, partial [Streptomyces sp. NPDC048349]|uniref:hypothetical protein n=1 Tax=Streptomyces sp. NPDC048349 TaxID=3155486 RepID=UPI003435B9CE